MPRNVTVTFQDNTTHVYNNAPDDISQAQVAERAQKEFGKQVIGLSRSEQVEAKQPAKEDKSSAVGNLLGGAVAGAPLISM